MINKQHIFNNLLFNFKKQLIVTQNIQKHITTVTECNFIFMLESPSQTKRLKNLPSRILPRNAYESN